MVAEKWSVHPGESQVIDLELVRSLKLGLIGGQVDIIAHDEPGARIEIHSVTGRDLRIQITGDALEIDHPQLRWDNFIEVFKSFRSNAKVDLSVLVPRDIALNFGVVTASGLISGVTSNARVNTVSGDIVIDGLTGDIEANSVSGEISIRDHTGKVKTNSVSGDILCTGTLDRFSSENVSGSVFLDLSGIPDRIRTNAVSGGSTIRLDEGVGARLHVNSVSGKLQLNDLAVKGVRGGGYSTNLEGEPGSWVDITTNSVSGNISVMHRIPARSTEGKR